MEKKMEIVKKIIQKFMVPELEVIKEENREIKTILRMISKRLDDINAHLVDQSRRMDETNNRMDNLRVELRDEIVGVRGELKSEMAGLREELKSEIARNTMRIDDTNKRIDSLRMEVRDEIAKNNMRMDKLYEVIVRREEHEKLETRMKQLEQDVAKIRAVIQEKIAA